jgi:hypothetical protein
MISAVEPSSGPQVVAKGEVSNVDRGLDGDWDLLALVLLGVHPPSQLSHLLDHAAYELGSAR